MHMHETIYVNLNLTNLIKLVKLLNHNPLFSCWAYVGFAGRIKNLSILMWCVGFRLYRDMNIRLYKSILTQPI
jgi:hypothetical protein